MDSRCASYSGVGSMAVMVVRLEEKGQMILSGCCKQRLVGMQVPSSRNGRGRMKERESFELVRGAC